MKQELMIALLAVLGVVLVAGLMAVPLSEEATIMPNVFASHGTDFASCNNDGLYDGENGPFSQELYDMCGDTYYDAFIEGCMSVEGNTRDVCESATDG
jgi:hypothetical protein